jgi:hypothetical protein
MISLTIINDTAGVQEEVDCLSIQVGGESHVDLGQKIVYS